MTKLGSGTSGVVYKGIYSGAGDPMDCAIKVIFFVRSSRHTWGRRGLGCERVAVGQ